MILLPSYNILKLWTLDGYSMGFKLTSLGPVASGQVSQTSATSDSCCWHPGVYPLVMTKSLLWFKIHHFEQENQLFLWASMGMYHLVMSKKLWENGH